MNAEPETPPLTDSEVPDNAPTPAAEPSSRANTGALWLNRIALLLGFAGVFIAGVMSLAHAMARSIPCGENGGCNVVAQDPSSQIFGIPVAYLGLGAYVVLAAISAIRALRGLSRTQPLGILALIVSGAGALFSFYLQYIAFTQIHAFCVWCLASAIVMCLSFLVQAAIAQSDLQPETGRRKDADVGFTVGLAALALLGIGWQSTALVRTAPALPSPASAEQYMVTKDSLKEGPDTAPVKIVEFSDLLCGTCRLAYPEVRKFVADSNGKAQLVFRHYPIYGNPEHKMSLPGAYIVEYAAERGKGFEFIDAFFKIEPPQLQTIEQVFDVAKSIGLDLNDVKARMKDKDPAYQRVTRDIKTARDFNIHETPSFVIFAPGVRPVRVMFYDLMSTLKKPEYQQFLKPNGK
ncbi:MAG: hypothetical protein QOJ65_1000 [Fimbriimonadaceae bacterium]|jgi:protein-disulfide isomerase|nr:hypothetical protein [Fimbriimonadaceae bacterium]